MSMPLQVGSWRSAAVSTALVATALLAGGLPADVLAGGRGSDSLASGRIPHLGAAPSRAQDRGLPAGEPATPVPPVDWPELPDVRQLKPLATLEHFTVYASDAQDPVLTGRASYWSGWLEELLDRVEARLRRPLESQTVHVVFARAYNARCPARGLAVPSRDPPLLLVYVDERTVDLQIRGVLAHEIAHHVASSEGFVGDGVLTEGIANWGAGDMMLTWQGFASWDDAVLQYLNERSYVSIADEVSLSPVRGEDCIMRRDRVYNTRVAFVDWLIRHIGLDTVLEMPYREVVERDSETGEPLVDAETEEVVSTRVPDYRAATGYDLAELEIIWLMQIWAER